MLASRGVDTFLAHSQALDWLSAYDVGIDDFIDIIERDMSVPDCLGIDHEIRTMLALVQASRLVGADASTQPSLRQLLLESLLQFRVSVRITTSSRMSRDPLVPANKNVLLKSGHGNSVEAGNAKRHEEGLRSRKREAESEKP